MAASDAIPVPRKNAAYRFYFAIRNPSDATLITTWAGQDSEVSKDGAGYADCTNEATEIGTSGTGYIDLTADEMNADAVLLKVTVTNTGAVPLVFVLYPEEVGDYRANVVQVSGDATAADTLELFAEALDQATGQLDSGSLAAGTLTEAAFAANFGDTDMTLPKMVEMMAAFVAGRVSRSSAAGVTTLTYKKRDGTTTSFTTVANDDDGDRDTTGSLS
jgi:hypothetical protein